jgi:hypothetical protein
MSRYIDADKLLNPDNIIVMQDETGIDEFPYTYTNAVKVETILNSPTADVVEVTRCKDCFYAEEMEGIVGGTCLYCTHWCKDVDGDTFCSNGFSTTNKENE